MTLFNKEKEKQKLFIVEGAESVWHYHLSETGDNGKPSLCGKGIMMQTEIPLSTWNTKSHIPTSYCKKCEEIAKKRYPGFIKGS